jgi:glycosyltransferase involved in cell wall biosynthesis
MDHSMTFSTAISTRRASVRRRPAVPSWGIAKSRNRIRLLAVAAVRDEMEYLPGFLDNVAAQVDGIVALDDGSRDGSAELLESHEAVLELIRIERNGSRWDEVGNYKTLVAAALQHRPDWIISLDADERLEREFRPRAERVIRRGSRLGLSAFAVQIRELWDSPDTYRVDGVWGRKAVARLFRVREDHVFDERRLHAVKAPLQSRGLRGWTIADLAVYHLRMLHPESRAARRRRYEELDPEMRFQPGIGYAYLTDATGIRLKRVPRERHYRR